ncbi:MAG: dihydroneopterin aldolase [Bacteroidetes bacterium]|nr:dihydroneopterin aldolase [Bacteroidota bacterium]HET6245312.1 dihydroneopterin aldolase [Bacteroidia bacterium]
MGIIHIEGMEFFAFHGLLEEEQKTGNRFVVDLKLEVDFTKAAETDDIQGTVNYQEVHELVKKEMYEASKLIEHVAKRIQTSVLREIKGVQSLEVKVIKFRPPVKGIIEKVSVVLKS